MYKKTPFLLVIVIAVASILTLNLSRTFAATGQVYLSPASKSVQQDSSFGLSLRITPATTVDGVEATVTFDTTKLQLVSVDTASSAFPVQLTQSTSGGTISLARGNLSGGVSADALVAVVNFKALVASGSSSVQLTAANATASGSYTNPSKVGATVSFTAIPVATPTTPSTPTTTTPKPTKPTTTTPTTTQTPTATPTPTKTVDPGQITTTIEPQLTLVRVKADCKNIASFQVKYGLSEKALTIQTPIQTNCQSGVQLKSLVAGTSYYYQTVATDSSGKTTTSAVQSFKTKGYSIKIIVLGSDGKPLVRQKVTLHSDPITGTTDGDGAVTFNDVPPGKHNLVYKSGKQELSQAIQVADVVTTLSGDAQTAQPQNFSIVYAATAKSGTFLWVILIGVLLVAIAEGLFIFRNRLPFGLMRRSPVMTTPQAPVQGTNIFSSMLPKTSIGPTVPQQGVVHNPVVVAPTPQPKDDNHNPQVGQ